MRKPHLGVVIGGTVLALAMAVLLGVVLPMTDAAVGSEAPGKARPYTAEQIVGRKLYVREGCFTCHTQMVRDAASDRAMSSSMSQAGDYNNEAPNLIGLDRVGPDLSCIGDRETDLRWHVKHLRRPQSEREGSTMPAYGFLTARELNALAAYLTGLRCGG